MFAVCLLCVCCVFAVCLLCVCCVFAVCLLCDRRVFACEFLTNPVPFHGPTIGRANSSFDKYSEVSKCH